MMRARGPMAGTRLSTAAPAIAALVAIAFACAPAAAAAPIGGHDAVGCTAASRTWYFAEGNTRAGFNEYLCLFNPGDGAATATVTYMLGSGSKLARSYGLAPRSRTTVNVAAEVPTGNDVSVALSASQPVVAERPMYFTYKGAWPGGHDVLGATSPRSDWYFAEGTTREGYEAYICIQNPNESEAPIDLTYFCGDGNREERRGVSVPAMSRFTVTAFEEGLGIGRHNDAGGDFSVRVSSAKSAPVVAERPMYFQYKPFIAGGHDVVGAAAPAWRWCFAEGSTRDGFDTYLCVANPGEKDALVDITYYCGDGAVETRRGIVVNAGSRFTVPVHEAGPGLGRHNDAHGDFSAKVESTNGVEVVAERSMYFSYRPFWTGGHDVVGATDTWTTWYFAEGCSRPGFDTYLCLANPGEFDALVDITYYCGDGAVEVRKGVTVPRRSRVTARTGDPGLGIGRHDNARGDFSIKVESTNGVGVVAERPMYFGNRWRTIDRQALASNWRWGEVARGNTLKSTVALTFDVEGSAALANGILDILEQRGVSATFFVTGQFAASCPGVVIRMATDGHEIANHSVSHPQFTRISDAQLVQELAAPDASVLAETGLSTKPYFRFPYGERNAALVRRVNAEGYLSVYWTIDPQEWRSGATARGVQATIISQACNGAIVLMHDRARTVEALPGVIDGLRARGFAPATLTEALFPGP